MSTFLYPASPADVNEEKLAPSPSFKQQVSKVIFSIVLFLMVYMILVITATGLAIACLYAGISLITAFPGLYGIIAGLGLMAVGVSVTFFLIKFIFAVSKNENKGRVEIMEEDQPQLFAFIRKLSTETNTPFPGKIFVSPDVNAAVFYNSSFWSMFFPVRKNLEIGLGLVNAVNVSEFKAVMAHEFGHFSQRSMKLGSFTYNLNRIIYNMLYENNSYADFLQSWGRLHGLFGLFAGITAKIAEGIQWILRKMYTLVNKNYMGLSREMEFHADAVAASVAGGNNMISGLSRSEIAQSCYDSALRTASEWLNQNRISKNIFSNQLSVLHSVASEYQLPVKDGLPEISFQLLQSFSKSRINYKDQWASHPTLRERKEHLDRLGINSDPDTTRAWAIFNNPENLQEKLTANLYEAVTMEATPEVFTAENFEEWQKKEKDRYALPAFYRGFYDGRYVITNDWNLEAIINSPATKTFEQLFNEENAQIFSSIRNNEKDLATVKAIKEQQIDVSSFDFDGTKYTLKDTDDIVAILEKDILLQTQQLEILDKEAFAYFYKTGSGEILKQDYEAWLELNKKQGEYLTNAGTILGSIEPLYHQELSIQQINDIINTLKQQHEPELKKIFLEVQADGIITIDKNKILYDGVNNFINRQYAYFINGSFQNEELNELRDLINKIAAEWEEYKYTEYKKLLEKQERSLLVPAS